MEKGKSSIKALFCALNAKYIHFTPAPFCLAAGVKLFAPEIDYDVFTATINESTSKIVAEILAKNASVVTFSCYIWNIEKTKELCIIIKEKSPQTIIALGGPEVSYNAEDVLQECPFVDYILCGEGEESVPKFLQSVQNNLSPRSIAGVCGRENGTIYTSAPCILSGTPPSPFLPEYIKALNGRIAYIETSRGCPYTCAFCLSGNCGMARFFDLSKSQERILQAAQSGAVTIKFVDRTFNANAKRANEIISFIMQNYGDKIPYGVCFHFEIAGDILHESTIQLLKQAPRGLFQLEIGMQSFNEKVLSAVNRKTNTAVLNQNILQLVSFDNMHIHTDLIAGLPFEDLQSFIEGFNKAYALKSNMLQLGFLKLLHGSAMRSDSAKFPCEYSKTPPYEVINTPWISAADIEKLREVEDALERLYNSARFHKTLDYLFAATKLTPFELFLHIGKVDHGTSTQDYVEYLFNKCILLTNVDKNALRDAMCEDVLESNICPSLPKILYIKDSGIKKYLNELPCAPKGIKRRAAMLYTQKKCLVVDYAEKDIITGRFNGIKIDF